VFQKIKSISLNVAVYGMGDVATHIVSLLLVPFFTRQLDPFAYGVWNMLLTASLVAKILFRWGVDASFMRFFYDCEDDEARQRLASTILYFLLAANGVILLVALVAAPFYSAWYFKAPGQTLPLQLMIVSTFIGGFFFLPFHVFRIRSQARLFSMLTFTRSASTVASRVLLVLVFHYGVMGLVVSELVITSAFAVILLRWFVPLVRPVFSRQTLKEVLRFGLPRVPHGIAQQVVGPTTDPYLMSVLLVGTGKENLATIGLYGVGSSFGLALKFFLTAFEYAWAPFYFKTMKEEDAQRTFSTMTTYGLAVLVLLAAGLSAVAKDLLRLMTAPQYHGAWRVIPPITIAVTLQGWYLLTSIGLNITKRTQYYPLAAGVAAATNVLANIILIPRFGMMGPAWSNVISYAVLAGIAFALSRRFYPIQYEYGRVVRVVVAGAAAYLAAVLLVPDTRLAVVGLLIRGTTVLAVYPAVLGVTGFFHARELARLKALSLELRSARVRKAEKGLEAREVAAAEQMAEDAAGLAGFEEER
jgi:O-antigen/teichoic acid export membrane protein